MNRYPLIFSFTDTVSVAGFTAEVLTKGRLLASLEPGGVWLYGVNPGGLASGDEDLDRAYVDFRRSFSKVLSDIAEESADLGDFSVKARAFLDETNEPTSKEWMAGVEEVRAGKLDIPGMERKPAEAKPEMIIRAKTEMRPDESASRRMFASAARQLQVPKTLALAKAA
jgi:hypothetical protein